MKRIGILGANGQVGAELCLLLSNHPDFELAPICRNPFGSAFLRYSGLPCRHGLPAEPAQARALVGDCAAVVHVALAGGTPRQIYQAERALIENAVTHSPPGAIIIYFSTQSVYRDPRPGRLLRWRSAYGQIKLASEQLSARAQAVLRAPPGACVRRIAKHHGVAPTTRARRPGLSAARRNDFQHRLHGDCGGRGAQDHGGTRIAGSL
jgi:nucleoside-diphosphate-sugar epimerase